MCGTDCFLMLLSVLFPPIGGTFSAVLQGTSLSNLAASPSSLFFCTLFEQLANHKSLVWVKRGVCGADSLINIALLCLGFLPGLIHAWYIILKYPEPYPYEGVQDRERGADGSTTYYYVSRAQPQHPSAGAGRPQQQPQGQTTYGTVGGNQPSGGQFPGQQSGVIPGPKTVYAQHANAGGDAAGSSANGEGSSEPPPTYADVIKGDHKVQHP